MRHRDAASTPVLITEAALSGDEELARRKKRYLITMIIRGGCVILATLFIGIPWLALLLFGLGMCLPWIAVIIANDGPPKKAAKFNRLNVVSTQRQLESGAGDGRVIDDR
jgi:hypothetical protein